MRINTTSVQLPAHGIFTADNVDVAIKLASYTKRSMVREIADVWPEMIRDKTWTRAYLNSQPAYVLAVILCQI